MASFIFNMFSKIFNWILQKKYSWTLTHYLNDFVIYFYANIDLTNLSKNFKMICKELVFALVNENEDDCIVSYLDLELDIIRIEATTKNVEHKSLQIESAQWGRNFNLIPFALSDQRFIIAGLS